MACQQLAAAVTALPSPSCPFQSHTSDPVLDQPAQLPGLVSRVVAQALAAAQLRGRCSHETDELGAGSGFPCFRQCWGQLQLKRPPSNVNSLPAHALAHSVGLWVHRGLEHGLLKVGAMPAGMGKQDSAAVWAQALPHYSPRGNISFTQSAVLGQ